MKGKMSANLLWRLDFRQEKASLRVSEGGLAFSAASAILNSHQGNLSEPGAGAFGKQEIY